jgi:hypothetical protein
VWFLSNVHVPAGGNALRSVTWGISVAIGPPPPLGSSGSGKRPPPHIVPH